MCPVNFIYRYNYNNQCIFLYTKQLTNTQTLYLFSRLKELCHNSTRRRRVGALMCAVIRYVPGGWRVIYFTGRRSHFLARGPTRGNISRSSHLEMSCFNVLFTQCRRFQVDQFAEHLCQISQDDSNNGKYGRNCQIHRKSIVKRNPLTRFSVGVSG